MTSGPRLRIATAALFFAHALAIRTDDITSTFLMLGDQIRDSSQTAACGWSEWMNRAS